MAQLLVRDLPERVKERLRIRAAGHGRSMEAEARHILTDAVAPQAGRSLVQALREAASRVGGAELDLPARRETPRPTELG